MAEHGKVNARSGLRLRSSPRDGRVLRVLPEGSRVQVLGRETWLRVRLPDGDTGFVLQDYVDPAEHFFTQPAPGPEEGPQIVVFEHPKLKGNVVRIDRNFVPALERLVMLADADTHFWVTGSLREPYEPVSNAVVTPATRSNHHVGHAIDMNIIHQGTWLNSGRLGDFAGLPPAVQSLIQGIRDADLRWGGDFAKPDPVHIDDGLNLEDPISYAALLRQLWV